MSKSNEDKVKIRLNAPINKKYSIDIISLLDKSTPVNWHLSDWGSIEKQKEIVERLDNYFSTTKDLYKQRY